jgi:hypothetical protein
MVGPIVHIARRAEIRFPLICAAAVFGFAASGGAQQADPVSAEWALDRLVLDNGRSYDGLIRTVGPKTVEFMEIRRPPGRPMFALVRQIERAAVASVQRLSPEQRAVLESRLDRRFFSHAAIEAGRMESITLASARQNDREFLRYEGAWFQLDSTAERDITRRCVVRLEQMFLAYRQVMPARAKPKPNERLRIVVFGSNDEYHEHLRGRGIRIRNPAYFEPSQNLVVAGSDVRRFSKQLEASQQQHAKALTEYDRRNEQFVTLLGQLQEDLKAQGASKKERQDVRNAAWAKWNRQQEALNEAVKLAERNNAAVLDRIIDEMLTRLYHEAFHAYLDNYVYAGDSYQVPRWLNEGLAQIFEAGILDADTLRVDAPIAGSLALIQRDLNSGAALPLAEVLSADQQTFLVSHNASAAASKRNYRYSWGLTHYLTFEQSILGTPALEEYVSEIDLSLSPIARFEKLVGMPLPEFERKWRKHMQSLKLPAR